MPRIGYLSTRAAMQATRTIPIVMAATADPVGAKLVASLGRPGGNVTGMSLQTTELAAKRLQIARELVPGAARIALLAERVASPNRERRQRWSRARPRRRRPRA